jgi:hypothetical protein
MLNTVFEGVFVGLYTVIISLPLRLVLKGNALFFCIGFFKHFFGRFTGLHSLYCKMNDMKEKENVSLSTLLIQSILEGMLFVFLGMVLRHFIENITITLFFIIGLTVHILFEIMGIHWSFINETCN